MVDRNYAKLPLTRAEIQAILAAADDLEDVMNARHKQVKERGWNTKPPTKKAFVEAVLAENNLLRRPILLASGRLVVGRDADAIRALLGS